MMIKFKINENTIVKYCNRIFEIEDRATGNVFVYKSQLEISNLFNPDDFGIYFLYNNNEKISENSIYKLYTDDITLYLALDSETFASFNEDDASKSSVIVAALWS